MKLKEFQDIMKAKNIDFSIISSKDSNFQYFNGFNDCMAFLVVLKSKAFIINLDWDAYKLRKYSKIRKIIQCKISLPETIKLLAKRFRGIGINHESITLSQHHNLKKGFSKSRFVDISSILSKIRSEKTKEEIMKIKKACIVTDRIFDKVSRKLSKEKTEKEIAGFIKNELQKNNCTEAFPTIVASGNNSANIHHTPRGTRLKGFTIIDLGAKYDGYCCDATRTFYVGKPSIKEINEYSKVLGIMNAMKTADDVRKFKPSRNQYHALGHSLGLEVHEKPVISKDSRLCDNMVVALEPASYNKHYGIRIENTILVKNNKLINLNRFTKELITR